MLERLRRKFVTIVMILVGAVLAAVLGSSYITTYRTQNSLVQNSLTRTLYDGMESRPDLRDAMTPDGSTPPERLGDDRLGGLMGFLVDVDTNGTVLQTSNSPVQISASMLDHVIRQVVGQDLSSGKDDELHVAWMSVIGSDDEGGALDEDEAFVRIAIVDTTSSDAILKELAKKDLQIIAIALVVLLAISWWLASWALRPVENAWEQQRRFVADASHELKTPLAVIMANVQILEADNTLTSEQRHWVESTSDETRRMRSLVGDLLQLARADETAAGVAQGAMRHDTVDLSGLVEGATLEFDAIAFERGCMLEADVATGAQVTGDPEWLDRLVRILIDNACKYGQVGSTITVRLVKGSGHSTLTVNNQGTPIAEEDLPHVFERFYRSDKARTHEGEGGFGLGLAIAKGIVDAHGGKISVTSTEAAGTTFTVTL